MGWREASGGKKATAIMPKGSELFLVDSSGWIEFLGDGVVLATYRITAPATSIRSSVWIRREDAWQVRFHQGTPDREPGAGPPG